MTSALEVLNHRLTLAMMVLALGGSGLAVMDSRHASAMDVQELTQMIHDDRVEELEYKIEETEELIGRIMLLPDDQQTPQTDQYLHDLENKKERYIRKMDRLLGEE